MLKFFKRKKFKKDVQQLVTNLVATLSNHFPDLATNHDHWTLNMEMTMGEDKKYIQLLHQTLDLDYLE